MDHLILQYWNLFAQANSEDVAFSTPSRGLLPKIIMIFLGSVSVSVPGNQDNMKNHQPHLNQDILWDNAPVSTNERSLAYDAKEGRKSFERVYIYIAFSSGGIRYL